MDYKEIYNAALERAAKLRVQNPFDTVGQMVEHIFPELQESKDEVIRKAIISCCIDNGHNYQFPGITAQDMLAWLEKQCEQKPYEQRKECEDCQFNYAGEYKGHCQMKKDEQKPTDNVEPKFKVGDWVVYDHRPYQVVELPKEGYINLGLRRNGKVEFAPSPYCRHWTFQDAKDGDVLAFNDDTIVIFKDLYNSSTFHSYCHIEDGIFGISKDDTPDWWAGNGFHPATKGQRDLLFEKMKEEGYEWDGEKKELKKIKPKKLDSDKVIEWIDEHVPTKFEDMANYVQQFKEDFRL